MDLGRNIIRECLLSRSVSVINQVLNAVSDDVFNENV